MLNKAINTMEQLRKAEELRMSLINEAREALVILGAETQAENIQTITINKGKIVEVKTTEVKEVVIDNTDTETIERLRETIRNNNKALDDAYAEIEQLKAEIAELKATKEEVIEPIQAVKPVISETIFKVEEETFKPKSLKDLITYKQISNADGRPKRIQGTYRTMDGKNQYQFVWDYGFEQPIIYGLFDDELYKTITYHIQKVTGMEECPYSNNSFFWLDNDIAVYVDGQVFRGYTKEVAFVWDTQKYAVPVRKMLENALSDNPNHSRAMNGSHGELTKEGQFIVNYLIRQYKMTNFGQISIDAHEELFKAYKGYNPDFNMDTATEDELNAHLESIGF